MQILRGNYSGSLELTPIFTNDLVPLLKIDLVFLRPPLGLPLFPK